MKSARVHEAQRDVTHLAIGGDTTAVVLFKKPVFVLFLRFGVLGCCFFFLMLHIERKHFLALGKMHQPFFSPG